MFEHVTQAAYNHRSEQVREAQLRLLYGNSRTAIAVTAVAAPLLAFIQARMVPVWIVLIWLGYMFLVCLARLVLARRYRRDSAGADVHARWSAIFAGLAGGGWGLAGILLYAPERLLNQVFLVFVLGGMMLGGAFLLAPRRESFFAFLVPAGMLPAVRLLIDGDVEHVAMGVLAIVFTLALLLSNLRFFRTIEAGLQLQFENRDLVHSLQVANEKTQALNQQLEQRVLERTAELHQSNVRLRAEMEQRQKMEGELLRVRNLESLGVLAGGIAHDFNNFLTIVQGNIELAQLALDPESPVCEILQQTSTACRRGAFLSSQLLTFAKGGAPVRRPTPIRTLIMDAVQLARAGAPVSIAVDIAADLWNAEVDAGQIGQVLHNILLNAKQAMPEGGIVEVRAENILLAAGDRPGPREFVRISIRDYGPGIPAEILPRIFDPYFTTKSGGSGLGLATAYAIVMRHGGTISVDSKAGQGAVFAIDLPATREGIAPQPELDTTLHTGSGRLLVMDDEEALRTLLDRILTSLGYEVRTVRDGAEAIALYEAAKATGHGFDAVLLDLTVSGGMGGVEAAKRLKEIDPSAKLIVSSGYSDAAVMARFREYGFSDAIPKPWVATQLSEVFHRVLASDREEDDREKKTT